MNSVPMTRSFRVGLGFPGLVCNASLETLIFKKKGCFLFCFVLFCFFICLFVCLFFFVSCFYGFFFNLSNLDVKLCEILSLGVFSWRKIRLV